jgi:predicted GNAT family acetyltransferase
MEDFYKCSLEPTPLLIDNQTAISMSKLPQFIEKQATMGLIDCKNFKEVPVFLNFFQGSVRQAMIQSLAANGQDKDAWRKATDEIANLLHDDAMLTFENTSDVMKCAETYLEREITTSDNHAAVLKADASDSKEILTLKTEPVELKTAQTTVTTTQGQGAARRLHNKRRLDGGTRTAYKASVDVCKT